LPNAYRHDAHESDKHRRENDGSLHCLLTRLCNAPLWTPCPIIANPTDEGEGCRKGMKQTLVTRPKLCAPCLRYRHIQAIKEALLMRPSDLKSPLR
jgi:hypothetical protein